MKEKFDLSGKVALIVGGRGYLGQHFCNALNELGAKSYSADLPVLSLAAKKGKETKTDELISQLDVDVTDPGSVNRMVEKIITETSMIDILIYSVTSKPDDCYAPFTECSLDGWRKMFQAEMDGLFLTTKEVGKHMETARKGNIILLSSMYGVVGNDQRIYEDANLSELYTDVTVKKGNRIFSHAAYPAVKGGVISLTRYLAAYWEGQNIRVNCVSPGGVSHPGENKAFVEKYNYRVPLGRKADVEEIAGAVAFLSSDASSYINGHNLVVDGGWTAW